MTKSPLTVTLIPLVPLAALAWPLSHVLNQDPYQPVEPEVEVSDSPLVTAQLYLKSAHPFQQVKARIGEFTWTFEPEDYVQEIQYPSGSTLTLIVTVTWPPETPESAVLLTLEPEGRPSREHTLWGRNEVTEPITFTWEDDP